MKGATVVFLLSVLVAMSTVGGAFLQVYAWPVFLIPFALAALGLGGYALKWYWTRHWMAMGFLAMVMLSNEDMNTLFIGVGLSATLAAWSLGGFLQRMRAAGHVEGEVMLERAYLWRLALVVAAGGALTWLALSVRVNASFGVVVLLALLAIIGVAQAVSYLRRESD